MQTNNTNQNKQEPTRSHQVATLKRQLESDLKHGQYESFDHRLLELSYVASDEQWDRIVGDLEKIVEGIG
jgi:chaperonin cofactor prefoldin